MRAVRFSLRTIGFSLALSALAVTMWAQASSSQSSSSQSAPSRDLSTPVPPPQSGVSSSSRTESGEPVPLPEGDLSPRPNAAALAATPAAIDPTGPAISLETSEAMFDVMAALNTCGYNQGLSISDPVRQKVRDDIDQVLEQSAAARDSRDRLCAFIHSHTMSGVSVNLAAYISLALFLTPPPELTTNVAASDLPPDAATLVGLASPLRNFSQAVNLHVIWVLNHPAYEALANKIRTAMNQMLVQTDLYLKQPQVTSGNRRFLVIMEPLIAPGEENARVYGGDYIVVSSPMNGKIDLKPVKHTYLRFVLEPLIYARSESINQLRPILELVQPSPLPYIYKSDVLTLVTECMIRAMEAHTMDTGVPVYKIPAHIDRNQFAAVDKAENAYEHAASEVRRQAVQDDMVQGFILTQYFYDQLRGFDQSQRSLPEMVGIMIYGMNVDIEKHRVQDIVFASHTDQNVATPVAPQAAMLDEAEAKLVAGDTTAATQLAQKALDQHTSDPGRAQFILARASIMNGKMDAAVQEFTEAAKISHDLRTIAWSHIYLGRLDDLQGDRSAAIAEYQAAMRSRDGRLDTSQAAEAGLKAPFAPPQAAQQEPRGKDDGSENGSVSPQ
ncbi:MAG: tetratricopeptide repeat protein [Acidobacteriaceae bacterium]